MIRAPIGNAEYWDKWTSYGEKQIAKRWQILSKPSVNPTFDPEYSFEMAKSTIFRTMMSFYSRGDCITKLGLFFQDVLKAWELSNKLAEELDSSLKADEGWTREHFLTAPIAVSGATLQNDPRSWNFDLRSLNHYNWCFDLVSLALSLNVSDEQWNRLMLLIGHGGDDILLDRVIASRQPDRVIGGKLLHAKPYARLLKVIDAPKEKQAALLRDFIEHWYVELERKNGEQLWWHVYCNFEKHQLESGSYFGCWCLEAVAVVKAFNIDDSLCLGYENYPGDLLRPEGPTTHISAAIPKKKNSWFNRLLR